MLGGALALGTSGLCAPMSVTRGDGKTFTFSDCSPPEIMAVASDEGTATLSRRRCEVDEQDPRWPTKWQLEMVIDPATKELWLGRPSDRYVVLRKKIWGVRGHECFLFLMRSQYAGDVQNGEESIMRQFLERFIQEPHIRMWRGEGSLEKLVLTDIYGSVIYPEGSSQPIDDPLHILGAAADRRGLNLSMQTAGGHALSLTLSETLDILEARKDGQPVLVLFDGRLPRQPKCGFVGPGKCRVITPAGELEALAPIQFYSNEEGLNRGVYATALAAVLPGSGELWIGPADCKLASSENQVLGVMVNRPQELWVFRGRGVTIPGPPEGIAVFAKEAARFEQEFEAAKHQWKPDLRVNIRGLFPGDARFPDGSSFWMDRVSFGGNGLVVLLNSSNSGAYPEVVLSPDLRVVAAGVRELNAFGRLEGDLSTECPR